MIRLTRLLPMILVVFLSPQSKAEELGCDVGGNLLPEDMSKLAQALARESMNFALDVDGTFRLQLTIEFPPEMTPVDILQKFTDPKTVIGNSDLIKELVYQDNSKIQTPQACARPETVTSKSCKSLACAETKSLCSYPTINPNFAEYRCKVDTTQIGRAHV